jgi:diamine N-acetyltransferase
MSPEDQRRSFHPAKGTGNQEAAEGASTRQSLPEATIEAIARSLFKEGQKYGFHQVDYLRLVNHLLHLSGGDAESDQPLERTADLPQLTIPPQMPLEGKDVRIREFDTARDRGLLAGWLEDDHGKFFFLSSITAKTLDIDQVLRSGQNILGVITLTDATPIGMMAFLDLDRRQQKAELRKLIGEPRYRGRGFARQATTLWVHYGLHGLGLKKIYLNTLQTNIRNIRLNEALGFRVEGILRKEFYIDGEHHDVLRMALLNE